MTSVAGSKESDSEKRVARSLSFRYYTFIVRIAQDRPTGWYHISLRSLTTELKEPNQRHITDADLLEMRERSEGWSHASRAARIEGRTAGRSPRNDPDTYATAGGPARQVLTGVRGNALRRPDVPRVRGDNHHGGGNKTHIRRPDPDRE